MRCLAGNSVYSWCYSSCWECMYVVCIGAGILTFEFAFWPFLTSFQNSDSGHCCGSWNLQPSSDFGRYFLAFLVSVCGVSVLGKSSLIAVYFGPSSALIGGQRLSFLGKFSNIFQIIPLVSLVGRVSTLGLFGRFFLGYYLLGLFVFCLDITVADLMSNIRGAASKHACMKSSKGRLMR